MVQLIFILLNQYKSLYLQLNFSHNQLYMINSLKINFYTREQTYTNLLLLLYEYDAKADCISKLKM
jgi:hypothetical protein